MPQWLIDVLYLLGGIIAGFIAGFFVARTVMQKYLKKNH